MIDTTKVIHIVLKADMSGSKRVMLDVIKQLPKDRFSVSVISNGEGPLLPVLGHMKVDHFPIPSLVQPISLIKDLKSFFRIYFYLRREAPAILHTHSSKTGFLGRVAGRLAGVPKIIHHVHGFSFHEFSGRLSSFLYKTCEKIGAKFCDTVIFVSSEEMDVAIKELYISETKCIYIPNGADLRRFDFSKKGEWKREIRGKYHIPYDSKVIMFCGRLDGQKDPVTLLSVIKNLLKNRVAYYFLIVGEGDYYDIFKDTFSGDNRVKLAGWVDNVEKYYAAADVFFLPSLWEGMPLSLLEALSMGVPSVVSSVKGNREVISESVLGRLIDAKNVDLFCGGLQKELLAINKERSLSVRNIAEARFDALKNLRKVICLYDNRSHTNRC